LGLFIHLPAIQPYRLGEEYCGSDFSPAFELAAAEACPGKSDLTLVRANRRSPESADRFVMDPKVDEDADIRS